MPSSALTPSGFGLNEIRKLLHYFAKHSNCCYLHLCEGMPTNNEVFEALLCKSLAYLVTDFVKAKNCVEENLI